MEFETITYTVEGSVVRIGLNREKAINAMNDQMKYDLLAAFRQAAQEVDVKVVILFGHGNNFSSGVDLKSQKWPHTPKGWNEDHFGTLNEIGRVMWEMDAVVLCSVKGFCLGAGVDLAVMADFVLAAESSTFGEPEIMMNSFSPTLIVPWLVNMKSAREFLVMGIDVSAVRAKEMGLVTRVFPDGELDAEVEKWAAHICNIPTPVLRMSKKVINYQYEMMGIWESIEHNKAENSLLKLATPLADREATLKAMAEKDGLKKRLAVSTSRRIVRR